MVCAPYEPERSAPQVADKKKLLAALLEPVSESALGQKVFGCAGVGFDFLPQRPDKVLYLLGITGIGRPPRVYHQLLRGDSMPGMSCQRLQKPIFRWRQLNRSPIHRYVPFCEVDYQVTTRDAIHRRQAA